MVRKSRGPDHIREHIEKHGYKHNYVLYGAGAYYYDLPYWTFVHLAKVVVKDRKSEGPETAHNGEDGDANDENEN